MTLGKVLQYSLPNFLICKMEVVTQPTLEGCYGINTLECVKH